MNVLYLGKGICAVTEDITTDAFVANWDGQDFTTFWDTSGVCFCEGEACAQEEEEIGCTCEGTADCCCKADNTCNYAHICQPSTDLQIPNKCLYRDGSPAECGNHGEFITCGAMNGVVYSTCGSGRDKDCGLFSGMCPLESYSGIRCGYKGLGTTEAGAGWQCGDYGESRTCSSSSPFLIGLCGSGKDRGCTEQCFGSHGILCGSIEGVEVDQDGCYWATQYNYGKFISCNSGYVGTGYCGSGENRDCGGKLAKLRCCPLKYPDTTSG